MDADTKFAIASGIDATIHIAAGLAALAATIFVVVSIIALLRRIAVALEKIAAKP